MASNFKTSLFAAFALGVMVTLTFKGLQLDIEHGTLKLRRKQIFNEIKAPTLGPKSHIQNGDKHDGTASTRDETRYGAQDEAHDDLPLPLKRDVKEGIEGTIGNTPLVRIKSLSEATGCDILAKAEVLLSCITFGVFRTEISTVS